MIIANPLSNQMEQGNLPLLGHLLWFTVSECQATREEIRTALTAAGLSLYYLPPKIFPRDAFRRATATVQEKRMTLPNTSNRFLNLMIREVKTDQNTVIRHLVEEEVDSENVRLKYTPSVEFYLDGDRIRYHRLPVNCAGTWSAVEKAIEKVMDRYDTFLHAYDTHAIRTIVTSIIRRCASVSVRPSGGVYFTPIRHKETIHGLKKFLTALSSRSVCYTVPVIDEKEHREMVQNSLETAVSEEAAAIIKEAEGLAVSGAANARAATRLLNRAKELQALADEYAGLMATRVLMTRSTLEHAMVVASALSAEHTAC